MSQFLQYFNELDDPRTGNATRHLFPGDHVHRLFVCGGETGVDMADFAEAKEKTLREFLKLPFGTPSHDTFSTVFQALEPEAFAVFFTRFIADFRGAALSVIKADTLKGSNRIKFKRAGWDNAFLRKLISQI